jgi:hypothetical protein
MKWIEWGPCGEHMVSASLGAWGRGVVDRTPNVNCDPVSRPAPIIYLRTRFRPVRPSESNGHAAHYPPQDDDRERPLAAFLASRVPLANDALSDQT